jgi:acetolactate synthase-1/2/3 large subunit
VNGAQSLLRTLIDAGLDVCFANPGTTELPLVQALDDVPGMRAVLCLFEGVCTGAADGYARMTERPGLTLLHLGPGFANGIACLHDARRARSAIVNLIGDHATWHLAADAPLTSDIESLARPVSAWMRRTRSAGELAGDAAEAVAAASTPPGQIATLIVPHDYQLAEATAAAPARATPEAPAVSRTAIAEAAALLKNGGTTVLYMGGHALRARGLRAVARIAAATGCALMCETFPTRWERGAGTPAIERLPYFPDQGIASLSRFQSVVLAGVLPPVSFFGYPGIPSYLIAPDQRQVTLAAPHEDVAAALEALADVLGAAAHAPAHSAASVPPRPSGVLKPDTLSATIAALLPADAIVFDESNTSMGPFLQMTQAAPPHTLLCQPGGAIGLGPPCATGAAVACPDRPVINLQADGSAMYTLQALWTQAREQLKVTTIICNNRSYRILGIEMARAGLASPGPQAARLTALADPPLDWVSLSRGLGVPAVQVESADDLARAFRRALAEPGPHLIDALL